MLAFTLILACYLSACGPEKKETTTRGTLHALFAESTAPVMAEEVAQFLSIYGKTGANITYEVVSSEEAIRRMVRDVAKDRPQAITIFCTGLRGAPLVEELESETGIPIYDTIATVVWKSLKLAGADPRRVRGWGKLFREVP